VIAGASIARGLALPLEIGTGRGLYRLIEAAPATTEAGAIVLTLAFERADGIERLAFRCHIGEELVGAATSDDLISRLQPWAEREFETIREAALRSIRGEHKLHEIVFAEANRGPF
jgi:hypothetical protein